MRIIDIVEGTTVDGPGLRTSIYFAGCDHRCPGCHNPQTWPRDAGSDMSLDEVLAVVDRARFNVTFSGGDPFYQPDAIAPLADAIRSRGYTIWCYSGFTIEELIGDARCRALLPKIDVLVDGPFIERLRDRGLRFRGSSNQRIIDVGATLASGTVVLWEA